MSPEALSGYVEATAAKFGIPGVAAGVWADGREGRLDGTLSVARLWKGPRYREPGEVAGPPGVGSAHTSSSRKSRVSS